MKRKNVWGNLYRKLMNLFSVYEKSVDLYDSPILSFSHTFVTIMSETDHSELQKRVEEYIRWDPVKSTREEIESLYEKKDWATLEKCIMNRLAFGTAGRILFLCCK